MRALSAILIVMFVAAFAGCSGGPEKKLVGVWEADFAAAAEAPAGSGADAQMAQALAAMAAMSAMSMTLTINRDGTCSMAMGMGGVVGETESCTWEVTAAEGDDVTVAITEEGDTEPDSNVIHFVDNDTFTMQQGGDTVTMRRQTEE